jgi:hypothetical protein
VPNVHKRGTESPVPLTPRMKRFKSVLSAKNVDIGTEKTN